MEASDNHTQSGIASSELTGWASLFSWQLGNMAQLAIQERIERSGGEYHWRESSSFWYLANIPIIKGQFDWERVQRVLGENGIEIAINSNDGFYIAFYIRHYRWRRISNLKRAGRIVNENQNC